MNSLELLNKEQQEAVLCTEGPLLILAGAGSGKTRVLTHRIAHLIEDCGVNPWNILAITFTNKAAGEMRERVDKIVGFGSESVWVSTFHSACVRILRRYIDRLGFSNNFTIYDTEDQKSVVKDVCRRLELDMENGRMHGHWVGIFAERGAETEVVFTETVTAKNIFLKPFVRLYLQKQQARYIADLTAAVQNAPR